MSDKIRVKKENMLEELEDWLIAFEIAMSAPLKPGDQVKNCREYYARQILTLFDPDSTFPLHEEEKKESEESELEQMLYDTCVNKCTCKDNIKTFAKEIRTLAIKKIDEIDDIDDWIEVSEAKKRLEGM